MIRIEGLEELQRDMMAYIDKSDRHVQDAINATVEMVEADAIKSIQRGTKTGRVYQRGETTHQASAPGEAPATDTGSFVRTIRSIIQPGVGFVGTDDDRGEWFEFGTMKMAERPWLRPAWQKNRETFLRLVRGSYEQG